MSRWIRLSLVTLSFAAAAPAFGAPTPPNPDRLEQFRASEAPRKALEVPAVAPSTIQDARARSGQIMMNGILAAPFGSGGAAPIPTRMTKAAVEVVRRDESIASARTQIRAEIAALAGKATVLLAPPTTGLSSLVKQTRDPTNQELAQAAAGFASAGRLARTKAVNFETRLAKAQPDVTDTQSNRSEALRTASRHYTTSGNALSTLSNRLEASGDMVGAVQVRDKANNTLYTATQLRNQADAK